MRCDALLLIRVLIGCLLITGTPAQAAPVPSCARGAATAPALERLRSALARGRFVAYQPTSLSVIDGRVTSGNPASIRADLEVLRPRFDALVTYDAVHGTEEIAAIAAALKFRALIIGVWNPFDPRETGAALDAARRFPQLVVGLSLGNEMIFSHRADAQRLAAAIAAVRAQLATVPLSTTEPFHIFEAEPGNSLLPQLDFMLVNVHPVFQPWFRDATDATAAQFVVNVAAQLAQAYCGPILIKETGIPTAPAALGFSNTRQASFYKELRARLPGGPGRAFAYFAAFDAPWRAQDATGVPGPHAEEAHWGLYEANRTGKLAVDQLPPLAQDLPGHN
jgi:exo-beta-1,3-glucanase (GH17 family)